MPDVSERQDAWLWECHRRLKETKGFRAPYESFQTLKDLVLRDLNRPASVNAWSKVLGVSINTAASWLEALCEDGCLFMLTPHDCGSERNFRKRRKFFFQDATRVADEHASLVNQVAVALRKACADSRGRLSLAYIRDKEKRAIDFVLVRDGQVLTLVQVKRFNRRPDRVLAYYRRRLGAEEAVQIVGHGQEEMVHPCGVRVLSFERFVRTLFNDGGAA